MKRMRGLALILVLAAFPVAPAAADHVGNPRSDVIVAMIDTGVYPWHQEFDYRGRASLDDQFVAWWDFTGDWYGDHLPAPGEVWDPYIDDPYDNHGHGTATASMAVGRSQWWFGGSYAPGFRLAVAKVGGYNGITGDIGEAIRWAVDTVGANVINISIGSTLPGPASDRAKTYAALRHARQAGVLVVVANGNGFLNSGVPGDPGWANAFSSSTDVLSVGASGLDGLLVSTDPEVVARYDVYAACPWDNRCYEYTQGTSFSAPTVAGMAAAAMQATIDARRTVALDYFERLLKYSATDTSRPPTFEGYGVLDVNEFYERVLSFAQEGRLPPRPVPDMNALYVDGGGAALRDTWSNKVRRVNSPVAPAVTGEGEIGPSTPALAEGERYTVTLEPGERLFLYMWPYGPTSSTTDIDLYLFPDGSLDQARVVAQSANGMGEPDWLTFRSTTGGRYVVFIVGWDVPVPIRPYLWSYTTSPRTPPMRFTDQNLYSMYSV